MNREKEQQEKKSGNSVSYQARKKLDSNHEEEERRNANPNERQNQQRNNSGISNNKNKSAEPDEKNPAEKLLIEKHKPSEESGQPVDGPPEILNEKIKETLEKMRTFSFDQDEPEDKDLPKLSWYKLENNAYYCGQWKNGQRHGKGKQIWADGNKVYQTL